MKREIAGLAAALLLSAACAEQRAVTGPSTPSFSLGNDSAGGGPDTTALHGLQWRSDSTMRSAYIWWNVADTSYYVSFGEGIQSGMRVGVVSYAGYTMTQCWDPYWGYWECPAWLFYNFHTVDPRDIGSGEGAMVIAITDTLGSLRIQARQNGPVTRSRWHDTMEWWPLWTMYNSSYMWRPAAASGELLGITIPATAQAQISQNGDHSIVVAKGR